MLHVEQMHRLIRQITAMYPLFLLIWNLHVIKHNKNIQKILKIFVDDEFFILFTSFFIDYRNNIKIYKFAQNMSFALE